MSLDTFTLMSGLGAIGASYSTAPYWAKLDGRPSVSISLWYVKFFIRIPIKHITPFGHGTRSFSWGFFWWPKVNIKPRFTWGS